jgi:hypothetical protein
LNDGQIQNPNAVRVALGTGYHRVEGNRRASRKRPRVSDPPPETPRVTIRNFFSIAVGAHLGRRVVQQRGQYGLRVGVLSGEKLARSSTLLQRRNSRES